MILRYSLLLLFLLLSVSQSSHNGDLLNNFSGDKVKGDNSAINVQNISEEECPSSMPCEELKLSCIDCQLSEDCVYGNLTTVTCTASKKCKGSNLQGEFKKNYTCQFCYQTEKWQHKCIEKANCDSVSSPRAFYRTNCTVHDDILCLGRRTFARNLPCNWTGGHRWTTALLLSVTLGGFGADRFYLGYWQEGIGKLFSFGGLGVWTIIDFILIAIQYLGPADGSLYI